MSARRVIRVDCDQITSERAFWDTYLNATDAVSPGEFGRNLDALWDAVESDVPGPGYPGDVDLQFVNCRAIETLRNGALISGLRDIASEVTERSIEVVI